MDPDPYPFGPPDPRAVRTAGNSGPPQFPSDAHHPRSSGLQDHAGLVTCGQDNLLNIWPKHPTIRCFQRLCVSRGTPLKFSNSLSSRTIASPLSPEYPAIFLQFTYETRQKNLQTVSHLFISEKVVFPAYQKSGKRWEGISIPCSL
jgi:hypothetical protein